MTERDAFEARFGAAVHAHVGRLSSDLDPFEFAHQIAGGEPRRHRRPIALGWRGVGMPRLVWILLLLAALLAAMVGGALMVGSQRDGQLPAVVPPVEQAYVCPPGSTPDEPGPVDQARPPQDVPLAMAFDRRAGALVVLADVDDNVETWTFDVCTNSWRPMHPAREPIGWVKLVYDVDADVTIGVASCTNCVGEPNGIVWVYDRQANTWTEKGPAPRDATPLFHDPVSGLIVAKVASNPVALWNYNVVTEEWSPIPNSAPTLDPWTSGGVYAYDVSVDRVVAYGIGGTTTWLFDIRTGIWSKSGADTPEVWGWGAWGAKPATLYDEAAERTVVYGGDGSLAAFDATADHWEVLIEGARSQPERLPATTVYDPVRGRLVGVGWPSGGDTGAGAREDGVVAFDLVTREWTTLLEPRGGQPGPP